MKQIGILLSLAIAVTAFAVPTLGRADQSDHERARQALRRGEVLPLTRILPIVQRRVPGDVIEIDLDDDDDDGRIKYEVKVLTASGRVIEVELDARTGAILQVEED